MIVLLQEGARPEDVERLTKAIRELGLDAVPLDAERGRALEVLGGDPGRVLGLGGEPAVDTILTRRTALMGGEPLWPHTALRVGILAILLFVALLLLSAFLPAGLGDAPATALADGDSPPAVEWYLRPLAWICGMTGESGQRIGGTLVLLFWLGIFLLPFLDRGSGKTPSGRVRVRVLRGAVLAILVLFVLLSLGVVS